MQSTQASFKNYEASIKNLKNQLGQLSKQITERSSGNFPSDTIVNPKEHCKAITIRSGKVIEPQSPKGQKNTALEAEKDQQIEGVVEDCSDKEEECQPKNNSSLKLDQLVLIEKEKQEKQERPRRKSKNQIIEEAMNHENISPYANIPFPQRLKKQGDEKKFAKFLDVFKKLQINIPFAEALEEMPSYAKFMKELIAKKRKLKEDETVALTEECSAIIQRKLPQKLKDPGSFTIPCTIGNLQIGKSLCDLGASINLMPLSIMKRLGIQEVKPTMMCLQLADRSIKHPYGVVEDLLVKVDKFIFPADLVILDIEEDVKIPLILGRPFLAIGRALIDVQQGQLILRVQDEKVTFNVFDAMKHPADVFRCMKIDTLATLLSESLEKHVDDAVLVRVLMHSKGLKNNKESQEVETCISNLEASPPMTTTAQPIEELKKEEKDDSPKVELKQLPSHLWYAFLGEKSTFPVIISSDLNELEEDKLLRILRAHKSAIGWTISDLKGISPSFCMHKILLEENYKPVIQPQRRLNPTMKEVVRKEVIKLLDAGIIYPISDSAWVSLVQVVPKKGGMTVVINDKNELIPTRTVTGWRMCIDYRRLNDTTRKDHFPLPFMDQMLERLAGHAYYCFLDGYSGYNQIVVDPKDQEKTAFTCPYGVFAYRRMPFGLCNAPATF